MAAVRGIPSVCRVPSSRSANLRTAATFHRVAAIRGGSTHVQGHTEPTSVRHSGTAPPNGYEPLFSINSAADTEALLVNAYETLIGAGGLTSDLAETTDGKLRSQLLAIGQLLGLAGLLVDRAMEQRCPT
ncbi:hypothetical protein K0P33_08315 [Pseudomonas sp. ArH3a]|nr:DUF6124 family protein [Pseudomonas sp. ArH3a]UNM21449.1 hypothetical protein K0P33_08315 [Pseudomonas sp. ArH3a]